MRTSYDVFAFHFAKTATEPLSLIQEKLARWPQLAHIVQSYRLVWYYPWRPGGFDLFSPRLKHGENDPPPVGRSVPLTSFSLQFSGGFNLSAPIRRDLRPFALTLEVPEQLLCQGIEKMQSAKIHPGTLSRSIPPTATSTTDFSCVGRADGSLLYNSGSSVLTEYPRQRRNQLILSDPLGIPYRLALDTFR
jgi:hypothetical protein